ncbi:MAG TPA: signal recognition particle-docking protein FtsY [Flavobacteriales bacterium]|jgi:fused signal recognition particle receptor|nr:signal recognition particle-docking protein FtsY [Flavobacteriales bacterium]HHZ97736.1 signal recognition particle-docking protein FtsY [Flavobacteriales bacterium]HIB76467.1 signal recognition particle-docking protein FtsY [Flavobacteriales bacterium]HIN41561.1 signal recognition particle-docking protein FtsY [Flavobacteriales bacterium]HIO15622.1 signal recognition particle-docking protein FtsY [Flavobacteriales bacterium]
MSFFKRLFGKEKPQSEDQVEKKASLDAGLEKSKRSVFSRIARVFTGKRKINDDLLEDLEEALMMSDVGVDTTERIIERLRKRAVWEAYVDQNELVKMLREEIAYLLVGDDIESALTNHPPFSVESVKPAEGPAVILVVGVNGVGKTTSIGKLAHRYKSEGKKVVLGAADTFRAAAVEQLTIWAERVGVPVISQGMGADPAAVAFDTLESAKAQGADVVIIDTAGRLHNKVGLMAELTKIKRVMDKIVSDAPHEVWLVIDGSTGQNALVQATQFAQATDITGLIVTKLDGTAKGGAVIAVCDQVKIPVRYIGVGEKMEDLQDFHPLDFIDSLLPESLDEK